MIRNKEVYFLIDAFLMMYQTESLKTDETVLEIIRYFKHSGLKQKTIYLKNNYVKMAF